MCGIAGILTKDGSVPSERQLTQMRDTLTYRGPDDAGIYSAAGIGLGHRRLSILDLSSAGHQPMSTPDGRFTIVFNGEIYNYQELASEYLSGIPLRSKSDTEVLLHLLSLQGMSILPRLRGMFAFALWDMVTKTLWLASDPFGKKPLYLRETESAYFFASEIKALITDGLPSLDPVATAQYFLYEYTPAPRTPFSEITQLPLGHYLQVTGEKKKLTRWWQPLFYPKHDLSPAETLTQADQLLEQAVDRRLVSDVPVGVFLSGGIDSTAITWYMRQRVSGPLHTFSVSFNERSFDETIFAQQAAKELQTEHHQLHFSIPQFMSAVRAVVPVMDTPLGDASLLPTAAVSFLAKEFVTVILDGDGSDELLGGYGIFPAAHLAQRLSFLPATVLRALQAGAALLPTRYHNFSFDFKVKSFLRGLPYPLAVRNQIWLGSFTDTELTQLLRPEWHTGIAEVFSPVTTKSGELEELSTTDAISLLLIYEYLQNDLLVKLDRATMFASVEARTPFLDLDFAEFAMRLPEEWKTNKKILRQIMQPCLPSEIVWRSKKGFGIPLGWWLKGPLHNWAATILAADKLNADGILNANEAQRLLAEHKQGKADHRKKLWTLLAWQLWYDHWIAKRELYLED